MIIMKILYYFCGEGLGHTSRTIAAGKILLKEHEVIFASYGYAREFAISKGLDVIEVPSEIKLIGKKGALDIQESIVTTIKKMDVSSALSHQKLIKKEKPDLIISDSFFSPAIIAKMQGIPFWMILNQTNIDRFFSDRNEALRWIGNAVKQINYTILGYVDKILIPDFPAPFTICEKNILLSPQLTEKTEYIGPLIQKNISEVIVKKNNKKRVFGFVRGFGHDNQAIKKLVNVAKELRDYEFDLVIGEGQDEIEKLPNLRVYDKMSDPFPLMANASVIICGGGHSTLMEAVSMGKPIVSVPYNFHFEQESNAAMIQELGLGTKIDYRTPEIMLKELIVDHATNSEMQKKTQRMARFAITLDGRKKLLEMAKEFENKL
ncbi:MAG: glycosyltransferase family protein [Candidatus Micrarchaeota archaeon]|nr:glycosyltransferase family protein [Candidatus Micrarchaeota archaeon]